MWKSQNGCLEKKKKKKKQRAQKPKAQTALIEKLSFFQ